MKKRDNPKIRWHLTADEREKIKSLSLAGMHVAAIARTLKIRAGTVSAHLRAMGLPTRPAKPLRQISPAKYRTIVALVKSRKFYCNRIAQLAGVTAETARRIAHELLGPGRFVAKWEPLSSKEPLRYPDLTSEPDIFLRLVRDVFPDKLPQREDAYIATAISGFLHVHFPEWENASLEELTVLDLRLLEAVRTLRAESVSGAWIN